MSEPTREDRVFVVTYTPLVASAQGRGVSKKHGLDPFIDGSIRREPDLGHERPSISCLCRADKFAPRLRVGDHVVYLAGKRRYDGLPSHWRLTAVLRVTELCDSHEDAAERYRALDLDPPSNCMVDDNNPVPLDRSHGMTVHRNWGPPEKVHRRWDAGYRQRARQFGRFVMCEPVFRELGWKAPVVSREDMEHAFGRVPGTQNPGERTLAELARLLQRLGIAGEPPQP